MRIAVLVIGAPLALLIFLQGCTGDALESMSGDTSGTSSWGIIVGFLFLVGAAFALSLPLVSSGVYGFTGIVAVLVATNTSYSDMWVWGVIAFVLGTMALIGWQSQRHAVTRVSPSTSGLICPRCHANVESTVRFCPRCGLERFTTTRPAPADESASPQFGRPSGPS